MLRPAVADGAETGRILRSSVSLLGERPGSVLGRSERCDFGTGAFYEAESARLSSSLAG